MKELLVKTDENYNDQYEEGVIFCEACTRASGVDNLLAAVQGGEVKKSRNEDDIVLYHFPKGRVGRRQGHGTKVP